MFDGIERGCLCINVWQNVAYLFALFGCYLRRRMATKVLLMDGLNFRLFHKSSQRYGFGKAAAGFLIHGASHMSDHFEQNLTERVHFALFAEHLLFQLVREVLITVLLELDQLLLGFRTVDQVGHLLSGLRKVGHFGRLLTGFLGVDQTQRSSYGNDDGIFVIVLWRQDVIVAHMDGFNQEFVAFASNLIAKYGAALHAFVVGTLHRAGWTKLTKVEIGEDAWFALTRVKINGFGDNHCRRRLVLVILDGIYGIHGVTFALNRFFGDAINLGNVRFGFGVQFVQCALFFFHGDPIFGLQFDLQHADHASFHVGRPFFFFLLQHQILDLSVGVGKFDRKFQDGHLATVNLALFELVHRLNLLWIGNATELFADATITNTEDEMVIGTFDQCYVGLNARCAMLFTVIRNADVYLTIIFEGVHFVGAEIRFPHIWLADDVAERTNSFLTTMVLLLLLMMMMMMATVYTNDDNQ